MRRNYSTTKTERVQWLRERVSRAGPRGLQERRLRELYAAWAPVGPTMQTSDWRAFLGAEDVDLREELIDLEDRLAKGGKRTVRRRFISLREA